MANLETFIEILKAEFPDDRLTWQKAIATFHPESADEAARLIKLANTHRQKLYITGFGNNIDPIGPPFTEMITIRTDRLNQLLDSSAEDFAVDVGGGYPLRELNYHLKSDNLYFPHSSLPYVGSVGGALAVGLTGQLHGADVPLKKYFIMAQIVTPEGETITPGSRCFKSVSGYDIVRLFAGSWGLLGLIVRATFRVMPLSGADDFAAMTQKEVSRASLLRSLDETNESVDALYSRKIKAKFDPNTIFPIV